MIGQACGKIILCGEHAVVYGRPSVALPVKTVSTRVTITEEPFSYTTDRELNEEEQIRIGKLFRLIFDKLGIKKNISFHIESSIPPASGMGSSASLSIAILRAISEKESLKLIDKRICELAYECENLYHGNPSGIDNTVIAYEKPVYFSGKHEFISLKNKLTLIVANTGIPSSTMELVAKVKRGYETDREKYERLFDEMGKISEDSKIALEKGDIRKLGILLSNNHLLLKEIGVSCGEIDSLAAKALKAGALGAKLTGAGGGGNIIALVDEKSRENVYAALKNAATNLVLTVIS